ncbi:S9 family peptidase [Hyphomonas sp.]|uniref:alpha/beta hydrolase family protein n=1 Tax=Hyphomonas sp. TaxID=87 RepID=UPI000AD59F78|nr:S9 family peptidase [Hyphomonas sp.]MBA4340027.1 S9 family peptidase [Hyphomonas sp.]
MRNLLISSAILLASACASPPQAEAPAELAATPAAPAGFTTYTAQQLYDTISYSVAAGRGRCFAPDGQSLLTSSDETGIFNAYTLSPDGTKTALTQSAENSTYAESYFPADGRVLVEADGGGNELSHLYVREVDGTLKDLTPGEKTRAYFLGWNQSGETFYVATNARDEATDDVYAYSTADYSSRMIYQNDGLEIGAISPDGKLLALVENVSSADANLYLYDLGAAAPEKTLITPHDGNIAYTAYGFTPDSQKLVYGTNEHGEFTEAWTHDVATDEKAALVSADWDVLAVSHSPTGRYRVSTVNADGLWEVTFLDTVTGKPLALSGVPDGEVTQVCFNDDETRVAFGVNTDTSPRNIYTADLATGVATRLTNALSPAIDEANLVTASIVRYPSFDGLEIPAIFYVPKTASAETPVPAIVWVHGGPGGQSQKGYTADIQFLVNNGYAVLAANNRGSSGYGKTFFHMDDKRHGEEDLQDIVWGRTYLESLDYIDGDRIGILGGSYGGFMTAAALAFEPEAFDVGVNIFGVTNWVRTLESIPAWWGSFRVALYDEMGDPATDAERHRAISPLFHASNIVKPMLVVQGANDPRVLQVESDEIVAAVRANGVPVEYVVFPDEGHGFQKKANRITAAEAYLGFLDKYLKGKAASPAPAAAESLN